MGHSSHALAGSPILDCKKAVSKSRQEPIMADSQLAELQNMRVLLEEARGLSRNLAYHRRARLETELGFVLEEVERQIEDVRGLERD